ncbi:ALMS1 centrosome and basal body associated protein [Gasterosteus aculeatus]
MEPPAGRAAPPQLPADGNATHSSLNKPGAQSPGRASRDQRRVRLETDGWELQQPWGLSLRPEFQDSNLSPALSLLPSNSDVEPNFTEYSLFQQSDNEFAPLSAYPDVSVASERFHVAPQDGTTQASECGSLSQHPLAQATILSEGASSCCSLSQHSVSLNESRREETVHSPPFTDRPAVQSRDDASSREKDIESLKDDLDKKVGAAAEDETLFLRKDILAQRLLELLEKDIGMPSSSSSAFSSTSQTSVKAAASHADESKSPRVCKPGTDQSMVRREGPPGEASRPRQQTQQPDKDLPPDTSHTLSSETSNITMGSRSTIPDESSDLLHRELLSEVERRSSREAGSKNQQRKCPTSAGQSVTPYPTGRIEGKQSVTRTNMGGLQWTGAFSAGLEEGHREQDLWFKGNQTGIDGSYLGYLPQSQSTPGFFKAPPKSSVKAKLGQLSAIESDKGNSSQSTTGISLQQDVPMADVHPKDKANQSQEEASSTEVQSLPSLNYMQKVDAWRANQSSGKTSLFDSLPLQGFPGIPPKKTAYEAVSDPLNPTLSQRVSLKQPPVSSSVNPNVTQSSSTAPSGSPRRRGEAVGGAPSDKDNTGSTTRPSASAFGRSQCQSSPSTTVMSAQKDPQNKRPAEEENRPMQDDVHHQPSATVPPWPRLSLGHFSDVSLDQHFTLSSSQGSYNSGVKLGPSVGASSVVSLEIDNYAPHWTSMPSTPPPRPRPQEFNIEERIPLYLRNLGIDQSPSTILTPFTRRGPIREPEFSPTDLCTVKGSVCTPTKSTQTSEAVSPNKGEFSGSSIQSVDSSASAPCSLDILGLGASVPDWTRRASPSSHTEAIQSERRSAPDEDSYPSTQQHHTDSSLTSSRMTVQLGARVDSDPSLASEVRSVDRDSPSPFQTSRSSGQRPELSAADSTALLELRKLLSQSDNESSAGSSEASSASAAARHLLSEDNIFLSLRKRTSGLQDSSFSSSSAAEDPRAQPSLLWARSSSESMLLSEKRREGSVGQESLSSSGRPRNSSTQALVTAPAVDTHRRPHDGAVGRGSEPSIALSQSARRAEPEGCSAAPPDTAPPALAPPPDSSTQQPTSTPADAEEEEQTSPEGPGQSSTLEDTDQGGMSDGSSQSSLAIRVAQLLQSESPATMVSSTTSTKDHEEGRAREWIKLKISGQKCETLELDKEDRMRIEEIKRELLLKNPITSQGSTDSESSASSSVLKGKDPTQQAAALTPPGGANTPRGPVEPQPPLRPNLEAQIREIAAREGVTLARTNPQPLTSPSTSPAPPPSPAPGLLHLAELCAAAAGLPAVNAALPASVDGEEGEASAREPSSTPTPLSAPAHQKRQDTVGGQIEAPPPSSLGLSRERVDSEDDNAPSFRREDKLSARDSSVSGVSSASEPGARTGHVSHVHLTLSPKATDRSSSPAVHSDLVGAVTDPRRKEFVSLRHSAASSPDEGVGLSSPPEWSDSRGPMRQRATERTETSTRFKSAAPQGRTTATSTQSFKPRHRVVVSPRPSTTDAPAVPVLLPYKPRGSEELFYVPQTEAHVSSTDPSDTTMESSHTGSDDAVPPRFSSEVLGHRDAGLDRGVTITHSEGIYSKRRETAAFKMPEPRLREGTGTHSLKPSPRKSVAFTRGPLSSNLEAANRDQGTGPVVFHSSDQSERGRVRFQPVHVDYDRAEAGGDPDQERRDRPVPHTAAQRSSALDRLWERFCNQWSPEESRPPGHSDASLLERLERLSRLIHGRRDMSEGQEDKPGREGEVWRGAEVTAGREDKGGDPVSLPARRPRLQVAETPRPADEDSSSSQSQHLCPADRDQSETVSTASMSTVDTDRLIRAFGAHRVQRLKASSSLSKLYGAIDRQKEERQLRRGHRETHVITLSETTGTDESTVAADSTTSTSTSSRPSPGAPLRTQRAKRAVQLVSKGIQAGDLEIVRNGTRRHTRDVGTTFPSPGEARTSRQTGRGGRRSPPETYPEGVSWFISADDLRSEARKENRPEVEEWTGRPSTAWFEAYSRIDPWREPLRQRQVHEDRNHHAQTEVDPRTKPMSSGLTRLSLQEALEMHRPQFLSQSRRRVKRLALQAEERKLQEAFSRERDPLFTRPGGPGRLLQPAGAAVLRRAVPRREMILRSKQIYETLPEVQRRREDERRKAEYRSYRLNAQLYNKRITNHVLGRRTLWH